MRFLYFYLPSPSWAHRTAGSTSGNGPGGIHRCLVRSTRCGHRPVSKTSPSWPLSRDAIAELVNGGVLWVTASWAGNRSGHAGPKAGVPQIPGEGETSGEFSIGCKAMPPLGSPRDPGG